jgi:hypothetical protein
MNLMTLIIVVMFEILLIHSLFSEFNGMISADIPAELQNLLLAEQISISLLVAEQSVFII